jgi:hypothetical protein
MESLQIIEIEEHDDIHSIRDRLDTAQSKRVALVLPWDCAALRSQVDLQVVQRYAAASGMEIAIVSPEGEIRTAAREVGLPAFRSASTAQRKQTWSRPHADDDELKPWTPSRRKRREAQRAAIERDQADAQARRRHPAWIAVKIGIFVLALLVVVFAAAAIVPSAQITLVPQSTRITADITVIADPEAEEVDLMTGHIPTREVTAVVREALTIPTTGKKGLPDTRATGRVVFINQLNTPPARISQGTMVRTSASGQAVRFILMSDVEVPAGIGAQAEGQVEAVEPGTRGNVDANLINEVEGMAALAVRVTNPEPVGGGGDREVRAVDAADHETAREQIRPLLREKALAQMQAELGPGEFIIPESLSGNILDSTFDAQPSEQADQVTLVMRVEYTAQAAKSEDANSLAFAALKAQTPPDYQLIPQGMTFERGDAIPVSDAENLYQFPMRSTGFASASLDVNKAIQAITGKPLEAALESLQADLPLKKAPEITVFPKWFPALPWLIFRIQAEVNPQG